MVPECVGSNIFATVIDVGCNNSSIEKLNILILFERMTTRVLTLMGKTRQGSAYCILIRLRI
jgi:hypothetical protein